MLVQVFDQMAGDQRGQALASLLAELAAQMLAQARAFGQAFLKPWKILVRRAAAGPAGALEAALTDGAGPVRGRSVVQVFGAGVEGLAGQGVIVRALVCRRGCGFGPRVRGRLGRGLGGVVTALDLEQGVLLDFAIHEIRELHVRHLQQLDCLLQLGCHHQLLRLAQIEP